MGLCTILTDIVQQYLPGRVAFLGYPDNLGLLNMDRSEMVSFDMFPHEGKEVVFDLGENNIKNLPEYWKKFDVVVDHGTLEHVANISNGFINAAEMLKPGGMIIHHASMTTIEHGFWNLTEKWMDHFYGANAFTVVESFRTRHDVRWLPGNPLDEMQIMYAAVRVGDSRVVLPRCETQWIHKDSARQLR